MKLNVAILALGLAPAGTARAQQPPAAPSPEPKPAPALARPVEAGTAESAPALCSQANDHYVADRCGEAMPLYERCVELGGPAKALLYLARCHRRLDRPCDEAAACRRLLARRDVEEADRESCRERIGAVEPRLRPRLSWRVRPVASTLFLDGALLPTSAYDDALEAGAHTLRAEAPGHEPREETVEVACGDRIERDWTLVPVPDGGGAPPPPCAPRWLCWTTVGVAAASGGAGGYFFSQALDRGASDDEAARSASAATVFLDLAAVSAGAAAVLWLWPRAAPPASGETTVVPLPGGAALRSPF